MSHMSPHVPYVSYVPMCVHVSSVPYVPLCVPSCPTYVPYGPEHMVPIHTHTHIGDIGDINNLVVCAREASPHISRSAAPSIKIDGSFLGLGPNGCHEREIPLDAARHSGHHFGGPHA